MAKRETPEEEQAANKEYAKRVVANWPAPTPEQLCRLRDVFSQNRKPVSA